MDEFGVGRAVEEFDGLRQLEQRRLREQHIARERDDGADRARIGRLLIGIGSGTLLLLNGLSAAVRGFGVIEIGLRQASHNRGGSLCGNPVEMPERQRKLDRERKQRQPRATLEMFSEPLHDDVRLARGVQSISAVPCYTITSEGRHDVNRR